MISTNLCGWWTGKPLQEPLAGGRAIGFFPASYVDLLMGGSSSGSECGLLLPDGVGAPAVQADELGTSDSGGVVEQIWSATGSRRRRSVSPDEVWDMVAEASSMASSGGGEVDDDDDESPLSPHKILVSDHCPCREHGLKSNRMTLITSDSAARRLGSTGDRPATACPALGRPSR